MTQEPREKSPELSESAGREATVGLADALDQGMNSPQIADHRTCNSSRFSITLDFNGSRDSSENRVSVEVTISGNFNPLVSHVIQALTPYFCNAASGLSAHKCHDVSGAALPRSDAIASTTMDHKTVLSFCAKSLLAKLVEIANRATLQGFPEEAWISFSSWFDAVPIERHREDAEELIAELTSAGFVDVRNTPKQKRYRANQTGCRYWERLNKTR